LENSWRDVELAFETLSGLTLEQWERTQGPPGPLAKLRRMGRV
jgi:hypothetical protein